MNDNAKLWVTALRSGLYTQTEGRLRNDDAYCCLGVACNVYHEATGRGYWDGEDMDGYLIFNVSDTDASGISLPEAVADWLGLSMIDASFRNGSLVDMNDAGNSFEKIAATIDSEPEDLFRDE